MDADGERPGLWARLMWFAWGEALLWLLFALFAVGGGLDGNDTQVTVGGLCALSAIGVRATRAPRSGDHG